MPTMYPIDDLLEDLTLEEGYRAHCYTCSAGAHTVAIGRNIDQGAGGLGISKEEAEYLLRNDIDRCIEECERLDWFHSIGSKRQAAIIHLCFWIGFPRLKKFKKMAAALAAGDYDTAADELLDSKLARDIPGRSERLAEVIRG